LVLFFKKEHPWLLREFRIHPFSRPIVDCGSIESGQHRSSFGLIDIGPIADAAAELFAPIADEKGIAFRSDIGEGSFAFGDGELLFEAIANLLDNAVKFTPPSGAVEMRVTAAAGRHAIQIDDTGPGIAAHEREAVKRRFHRGDPARGIPGSGLGLAIVSAIARLHGSDLVLTDGPGGAGVRAVISLAADKVPPLPEPGSQARSIFAHAPPHTKPNSTGGLF
jgi:signal transduction histidine kinase